MICACIWWFNTEAFSVYPVTTTRTLDTFSMVFTSMKIKGSSWCSLSWCVFGTSPILLTLDGKLKNIEILTPYINRSRLFCPFFCLLTRRYPRASWRSLKINVRCKLCFTPVFSYLSSFCKENVGKKNPGVLSRVCRKWVSKWGFKLSGASYAHYNAE